MSRMLHIRGGGGHRQDGTHQGRRGSQVGWHTSEEEGVTIMMAHIRGGGGS